MNKQVNGAYTQRSANYSSSWNRDTGIYNRAYSVSGRNGNTVGRTVNWQKDANGNYDRSSTVYTPNRSYTIYQLFD